MEDNKNLKGSKDILKYYRLKDTESYIERVKLIDISSDSVTKTYFYPQQDKILFNEEEIKKFSLDSYGESIPYIDGELTIFSNYFWDFWGYYLTSEATSLYGHLKRYAYGSKDWCYPNFDLIGDKMGKSRKSVLLYLDILERYGFAYKFNVLNTSRNNVEEGPIFKLRKQIPLLSHKLIYGDPDIEIPNDAPPHMKKALKREQQGLPPRLRKVHEEFVSEHLHNSSSDKLKEQVDYEKVYSAWLQYGEILKSKEPKEMKKIRSEQSSLLKEMNEHEKILLKFILDEAKQHLSKPSYETWFNNLYLKIDGKAYIIFAPNEFAQDWLKKKYASFIESCISKIENIDDGAAEVEIYSYELNQ
ncbi:DnaA N-terminal domain-containing protein [Bacillus sp. AFS040349]|uniref:DnaA N-terminal domain-containing protein n=1 Tax=Bacillus sp. AFS040349 TaxID=2033502 RepID=UPI000BFCDA48|nr:DnaA N-terminal domain-containing protein [Bacillus sp. AFS040349]PGT83264.1 hypothetical protein COD11_13090 [Bacillus sp. AFS040349]